VVHEILGDQRADPGQVVGVEGLDDLAGELLGGVHSGVLSVDWNQVPSSPRRRATNVEKAAVPFQPIRCWGGDHTDACAPDASHDPHRGRLDGAAP
jgi:hypothetical protein